MNQAQAAELKAEVAGRLHYQYCQKKLVEAVSLGTKLSPSESADFLSVCVQRLFHIHNAIEKGQSAKQP